MKFLVSAGPTREYFDPVRFLSNPSTGKMGFEMAAALLEAGQEVSLVSGPVSLKPPKGAEYVPVVSAQDMLAAIEARFASCDVLVMTAAVCDYRPAEYSPQKEHKGGEEVSLKLVRTPDILKNLKEKRQNQLVIGFAAETEDLEASGERKLAMKGLDMIVANDVSNPALAGFGSQYLNATLIYRDRPAKKLGKVTKREIASHIMSFVKEAKA